MSDDTYSLGERLFLLCAGVFCALTCFVFIIGFLWVGVFYHGPYSRHTPVHRVILGIVALSLLAIQAAKLGIEAYHGKVLD